MIKNRNFIVFSDDWGRYPSTLQHLMKFFAPYNKIIWVGSLGLRKPKINFQDFIRAFQKIKKVFSKKESQTAADVIQVNPFVIPFHDFNFIRKFNERSILTKLKEEFNNRNIKDPIFLTSSPIVGSLIGKLGETSSHYFCVDDYTQFEGAFNCIESLEKELLQKVDSTFATAEKLLNSRKPKNGNSHLISQGVDISHFKNVSDETPEIIRNIKKPVVGFFGLISHWIDVELIKNSALANPEFSFLIIGPADVDISELVNLQNVIYTGKIPYDDLPNYAKVIDVGLLPFKINKLTVAVNPLKLLEYMSFGIPVVSTALPEARKFGDLLYFSENENEFISNIKIAVNENDTIINERRKSTANKYSWQTIAEKVSDVILRAESDKK